MLINILFSFNDALDYFVSIAEGKEFLIILITAFLCFIEALLPFLPLVAIVNFSMVLLKPLCGDTLGIILSLTSSLIGSFIGYYAIYIVIKFSISKRFNKKITNMPKVKKMVDWVCNRSDTFIILLLGNPYTPSSIVNYALALADFKTKRYVKVTIIGKIFCIVSLGLFGIILNTESSLLSFIWILLGYTLIYIITWLCKKIIERKQNIMNKKTIKDVELKNKAVLMRVDFNVPMKDGKITDENRIIQALPTIKYALEHEAKLVLFSHLGRVKEEADKASNSLAPVAERLAQLLDKKVVFIPETRGEALEKAIHEMKPCDIVMFENTRFEDVNGKKESKNDPELGKYWASLGDLFVNDAFGTAHRAHASNAGIAANMDTVVAGFLMEKEITFIGNAVDNPVRPFVAILGGAKVSDKISVIENLLTKADKILICGAMAYTFYKALGYEVGTSKCELDYVEFAKGLLEKAQGKIVLPCDTVVAKEFAEDADSKIVDSNNIPADEMGMDIGPKTLELFAKELKDAKTVVWNGPAGVFEFPKFAVGTNGICEELANLKGATTIIGGGDSAAAAIKLGYEKKFTHISTGGGASLEYLEGKALPGVEILNNK